MTIQTLVDDSSRKSFTTKGNPDRFNERGDGRFTGIGITTYRIVEMDDEHERLIATTTSLTDAERIVAGMRQRLHAHCGLHNGVDAIEVDGEEWNSDLDWEIR